MKIEIDRSYLKINGIPKFIYGADYSYGRAARRQWRDGIAKMKAAGINTVTFYCVWRLHEPEEGKWDFSGNHDLAAFIDLIAEAGMFAICRMGPFVHGEYRYGGFPDWLIKKLGKMARTNAPEYLEQSELFYRKIIEIAKPRLITNGGPIILVQLENELGSSGCKGDDLPRGSANDDDNLKHLLHYYKLIREAGIDVPIIDINKVPDKHKRMPGMIDSGGAYVANCFYSDGDLWPFSTAWFEQHERPMVTIETGVCMMARYYDVPPYRNTNGFQGPLLESAIPEALVHQMIAEGCNGVGTYVFHDGWHFGPHNESMTNSANMNYQAPVTCVGTLRESYKSLKRIGWFVRSFEKELIGSHPQADWARAISYGISHPGVEQSGDLFSGYEQGKGMPAHLPTGKPVECLGRVTTGLNLSESNFLFMRNVRHHGSAWLRDIRVMTVPSKLACEVFQEYPKRVQLELPPGTTKIMPFFIRLADGVFLEHSTATPLDRRSFGNGMQLILHATREEIVETRFVVPECVEVDCKQSDFMVNWDSPNEVMLIGIPERRPKIATINLSTPVRLVLVDQKTAGDAWEIAGPDGALVAFSDLQILNSHISGNKTTVGVEAHQQGFYLQILSPRPLSISGAGIDIKGEYNPETSLFSGVGKIQFPKVDISFERKLIGNHLILEADLFPEMLDGLSELSLDCEFDGTLGRAYLDEKLISDHSFGRFLRWEIGLREFLKSPAKLKIIFENAMEATVIPRPILRKEFTIIFDKTDEGENGNA